MKTQQKTDVATISRAHWRSAISDGCAIHEVLFTLLDKTSINILFQTAANVLFKTANFIWNQSKNYFKVQHIDEKYDKVFQTALVVIKFKQFGSGIWPSKYLIIMEFKSIYKHFHICCTF